jgi:hypothetical protein
MGGATEGLREEKESGAAEKVVHLLYLRGIHTSCDF